MHERSFAGLDGADDAGVCMPRTVANKDVLFKNDVA